MINSLSDISYKPRFPENAHPGIGLIGCGNIVQTAHLPAYRKYNLNVVGVYDPLPAAAHGVEKFFPNCKIFASVEELLADPEIEIVDIATFPEQRFTIMQQAIAAGKHILSQKPFALSIPQACQIVEEAEARGIMVAVNQNGRWAPTWRIATLLLQNNQVGEVQSITHLFDTHFGWITGTRFDQVNHWLLYDYSIHWFDITQCWLAGKTIHTVRAREFRLPNQSQDSIAPWGMWTEISCTDGTNALLRSMGGSENTQHGHPFWIHGTQGTITGGVLPEDFIELDQRRLRTRFGFEGQWFPDGFAGTMGELMCAIAENRQPYHAARNNLLTLEITLAACMSAERDGEPVAIAEVRQQ